jgi:hypothetical protein
LRSGALEIGSIPLNGWFSSCASPTQPPGLADGLLASEA